ncbi:MAG: hypothetical protein E7643_07120 [Ruminococcaceae bacterium]|nr:hypothetical protein [Oscillospiraceae bacterium]
MKAFLSVLLSVLLLVLCVSCVSPDAEEGSEGTAETADTATATYGTSDQGNLPGDTEPLTQQGTGTESEPVTDGFPNEAESDGTKRY